MRKKMLVLSLLAAGVFGTASLASAHGMFGLGANLTPDEIATRQQTMFADQAALLGLNVDQIKAGWAQGQNLAEIAKANNISQADLEKRMQAKQQEKMASQLKSLVEKGVITQAQADARAKFIATKTSKKGFGRGMGHGMGKMGW